MALAPRGIAALATVAGLCAGALVAARPPHRLERLRSPALLLGLLAVWGALSAIWSIDPGRSLILDLRLVGLFAIGLALAAAAEKLEAPHRLVLFLLAGLAAGGLTAVTDFATNGAVSGLILTRPFRGAQLNQVAVGLAILALPLGAMLWAGGKRGIAVTTVFAGAAIVLALEGSSPKLSLAVAVAIAALVFWKPGAVCRALAIVSVVGILSAPLILPSLDRLPGFFAAADRFKVSAGHRLMIWSFAGERIAERPLFGWGLDASRAVPGGQEELRPGQTRMPLHPHDAALQVWLELGLPGAVLFAAIAAMFWSRLAAAPWPRIYLAASAGALAAALAAASGAYGVWQEWWLGTLALAVFLITAAARAIRPPPGSPGGDR